MRPFLTLFWWLILEVAYASDHQLMHRRLRRQSLLSDPFRDLPEAEFINTFRLGKDLTRSLIEELTPLIQMRRRRDGISSTLKILIALAFYASGSYQSLVGQSAFHGVSQPTVSRAVKQVTEAMNCPQIYDKYVKWPMNVQERHIVNAKFYQYGIPGVLGCVGGTHIAILRPATDKERYFNRKGYHSLNVMIICDSEMNVLCVDASNPGSTHDSLVWQSHALSYHLLELANAGEQVFLLGDSGYSLSTTMMTPILNATEGTPESHYNNLQVSTRKLVERCIEELKARFRCLLATRTLHYNPMMAAKIVNACCVLHNIANKNKMPVTLITPEEANAESLRQLQGEDQIAVNELNILDTENSQDRALDRDWQRGRALQQELVKRLWRVRRVKM